jgi:hypothetical protein
MRPRRRCSVIFERVHGRASDGMVASYVEANVYNMPSLRPCPPHDVHLPATAVHKVPRALTFCSRSSPAWGFVLRQSCVMKMTRSTATARVRVVGQVPCWAWPSGFVIGHIPSRLDSARHGFETHVCGWASCMKRPSRVIVSGGGVDFVKRRPVPARVSGQDLASWRCLRPDHGLQDVRPVRLGMNSLVTMTTQPSEKAIVKTAIPEA